MKYRWRYRKEHIEENTIKALSDKHSISSFIAHIIYTRNINEDRIDSYLLPQLRFLHPQGLEHAFMEGVQCICSSLMEGKKLAVWGDYDVDGVTSSALVHHVITAHGFPLYCYIPKREEGYGITQGGVEYLYSLGIEVILTVDCGISDSEAIEYARSLGIDIVVTDHHIPPKNLPPATAICNPKICESAYQDFAGVGVSFIVMAMVNRALSPHTGITVDMREVLDLVALGSVADLVPLSGHNRILVKNGLLFLKEAKRIGIRALKEVTGIRPTAPVTAGQVGFTLAPRINAAGRMGHAQRALELLISTDLQEARKIAEELNLYNIERQAEEERITEEAKAQAEYLETYSSLVVYKEDWHQGVIGIVASRLVECYYKPAIVLCKEGDVLKGSARSIVELDIYDALCDCKHLFLRFGGHTNAAGMSLIPENLEKFIQCFEEAVQKRIGNTPYIPAIAIDGMLSFSFASAPTFTQDIESLQPFGIKNSEPVFSSPALVLKSVSHFGENKVHATLTLYDTISGITLKAKAWHLAHEFSIEDTDRLLEIAYSPTIEEYKGVPHITVKLRDWHWL